MKRIMIGLVLAISLTVGIAGSVAAKPDNHACQAVSGIPASTTVFGSPAFAGGCEDHPAP